MSLRSVAHSNFVTKLFPFGSKRRGVLRGTAMALLSLRNPRGAIHFLLHVTRVCLHTLRELRLDSRSIAYIKHRGLLAFLHDVHARHNSAAAFNEFFYPYWIAVNETLPSSKIAQTLPQILIITSELTDDQYRVRFASVTEQTYLDWNLYCFVPRHDRKLAANTTQDKRVSTIYFNNNDSFCAEVNKAVSASGCDIIIFWPINSLLAPFALARIAEDMLARDSDVLYADQDKISPQGIRFSPYFKPAFGLESLRSRHYLGDMVAIRRPTFEKVGGLRNGLEGAEIYDLLLRVVDNGGRVAHLPYILSHEQFESLLPENAHCPDLGLDNGEEILRRVTVVERPAFDTIVAKDGGNLKFSLIILNKNASNYIIPLLEFLTSNERLNVDYEVIIGDTGTSDVDVLDYYHRVSGKVTIVEGLNYHFSQNNNLLAHRHAKGRFVGFLNNDIVLQDMDFLNSIENLFDDIEIGIVGGKLLYPDGKIQHGGVFFFEDGGHRGFPYHRLHGQIDQGQLTDMVEEVPAVTGAFLFCRRHEFLEFGGFDAKYAEESQDIDLCLKLRRAGKKVMFLNSPNIIHIENGTRHKGSENGDDRQYYLNRWGAFVETCITGTMLNHNKFLSAQ